MAISATASRHAYPSPEPSAIDDSTAEEALFEQASTWFARLQADDVSAGEREQFARWLATSPRHGAAWQEVQDLFAALEAPARTVRAREQPCDSRRRAAPTPHVGLRRPPMGHARAAGFALLLLTLAALWRTPWVEDWRSDYHTALGRQQEIALADGSHLLLNSDSAVTVDLTGEERRVNLLRGEAFFQVAHAPDRPFWVQAGAARARVTGTAFSVGRVEDRVTVTVAEGRVETSSEATSTSPVALTPGQSARYRGNRLEAVQGVELERELAWRNGQLVFVQAPLSQVIEQINRYRPGRIVLTTASERDRPVTAVFSLRRLDDAIAALEQTFGLRARRFTPYLILLG